MATTVVQTQSINIKQFSSESENSMLRKNIVHLTNIVLNYALVNLGRGPNQ